MNPSFARRILESVRRADRALARGGLLVREQPKLISVIFHAVVPTSQSLQLQHLDPRYCLSLAQIEQCIDYYLGHGYTAITPSAILRGLKSSRKYVMFTFDDGYYNNLQILPLLEAYRVPAVMAIATDYVQSGRGFWWDRLYRHAFRDQNPELINHVAEHLIPQDPEMIDLVLRNEYGIQSREPVGDLDRPLSMAELRELGRHPLIELANHTARHESLPDCSETVMRETIGQAQQTLERITGTVPSSIVYPYGRYNAQVVKVSTQIGLKLGFTVGLARQLLPLSRSADPLLNIARVPIVPNEDVRVQCELSRLDWRPLRQLRDWYQKLHQVTRAQLLVCLAQEGWM